MKTDAAPLRFKEICLGKRVEAIVISYDEGVHCSVFGGDRTHIGAVSVVDPGGAIETIAFDDHRDDAVTRRWAAALDECGIRPAVVEAGIHYDGLTKDGIREVLEATERLLSRVLNALI